MSEQNGDGRDTQWTDRQAGSQADENPGKIQFSRVHPSNILARIYILRFLEPSKIILPTGKASPQYRTYGKGHSLSKS